MLILTIKRTLICFLLILPLLFISCSKDKLESNNSEKGVSRDNIQKDKVRFPVLDPVALLEKHIENLEEYYDELNKKDDKSFYVISGLSYDVRKTESLVTPYIGDIKYIDSFYFIDNKGKSTVVSDKVIVTLAFQKNRWVLKEAKKGLLSKSRGTVIMWTDAEEFIKEPLGLNN